jgi:hypothetical protein
VNFNGTGTVAIRASGNVSSITDNGTGDYTINMTTALPDANYSIIPVAGATPGSIGAVYLYDPGTARTTTLFRIFVLNSSFSGIDAAQVNLAVFR